MSDTTMLPTKYLIDIIQKADEVGLDGAELWDREYKKYPSYKLVQENYIELMKEKYRKTYEDCMEVIKWTEHMKSS